jgi:hypothetical protein
MVNENVLFTEQYRRDAISLGGSVERIFSLLRSRSKAAMTAPARHGRTLFSPGAVRPVRGAECPATDEIQNAAAEPLRCDHP